MITAPFVGLSLIVAVATGPITDPTAPSATMSAQQKNAALQPLVRTATECIAQSVVANPRFANRKTAAELGDLIVDSMPACAKSMRDMIDAYDRYFGEGSGEAFFMGPYLDVLPTAINKWAKQFSEK
jgi:hypothetical protein